METPHPDSLAAYIKQGLAVEHTTSAMLDGTTIYFDDGACEGEAITVRADFDDLDSPVVGRFVVAREGREWVLRPLDDAR